MSASVAFDDGFIRLFMEGGMELGVASPGHYGWESGQRKQKNILIDHQSVQFERLFMISLGPLQSRDT